MNGTQLRPGIVKFWRGISACFPVDQRGQNILSGGTTTTRGQGSISMSLFTCFSPHFPRTLSAIRVCPFMPLCTLPFLALPLDPRSLHHGGHGEHRELTCPLFSDLCVLRVLRFNPWMWQRLAEVSACGSAALRSRSMPLAKSVLHIVRLRLIEDQRDGVSS